MFDSANLDHSISKATYKRQEPKLREALLDAQYDLKENGKFPVVILIAGVEGAGKGETVNLLNEWMDPRHIRTVAFGEPSDEERERPPMWRFWRALPPKGKVGVLFGAWHTQPIIDRVERRISENAFAQEIERIRRFEQMLTDEGALLLKYWFHLSKPQQKVRLEELSKDKRTRWRVSDLEWKYFAMYDRFIRVCEPFLRRTSTGEAPWIVVPGADARHRSLTFGRHLLSAMRERLDDKPPTHAPDRNPPLLRAASGVNVIRNLELSQPMAEDEYDEKRDKWQARLNELSRHPKMRDISVVAVFEGNDAAGKGGAIRRMTQALDARRYESISVAAPTQEELAQPYLWRFWRHLPSRGRFVIFDRSWYGRVLVERIEGYCSEADWMRAYGEINDFEQQLHDNRTVIVKFWLAISKAEQLRRFKARETVAFKRFKITPDDWRNRKKWLAYEHAICDVVDRTSTAIAPWTLVEANNKEFARIKVWRTLC
jgi:polyphosphate:AMP phosphotransferase